jgi:hypothetical protein
MNELKPIARKSVAFSEDYFGWTGDQARRLRAFKPADLDWQNLAEEIESLGRADRRALGSALKIVLEHLIKWRYQPGKRSDSWSDSIYEHRDRVLRILEDSPSLGNFPAEILDREYDRARRKALRDSKLAPTHVPAACPFTVTEVLNPDFWPAEEEAAETKSQR